MIEDEVMRGVREAKEDFARQFNYDIRAMVEHLRTLDEQDDRPVVRLQPRRPEGWPEPESAWPAAASNS